MCGYTCCTQLYLLYIFVEQNMNIKVILDTFIRVEVFVDYNFCDHIKIYFTW